jgi:rare lipoprotein A (peptidoglycan hydrolase)
MNLLMALMLSALTLLAAGPQARAQTFEDLWLTRIKPPPYGGVATEFDDKVAADGKRLHPYRDLVCAHMLEPLGQRLRVTNVANGKSVVCTVADKGPNRRFWPRREVDLTPPASKAIGCDGMCNVSLERVASE